MMLIDYIYIYIFIIIYQESSQFLGVDSVKFATINKQLGFLIKAPPEKRKEKTYTIRTTSKVRFCRVGGYYRLLSCKLLEMWTTHHLQLIFLGKPMCFPHLF